ncbi:MAG TPA: hypothetical protein VH595_11590 [Verrucomicrobiae bacterium]|jgi:hypothetical protein|nr:hypothetical protein [Verrucomicrobiae bacterium]
MARRSGYEFDEGKSRGGSTSQKQLCGVGAIDYENGGIRPEDQRFRPISADECDTVSLNVMKARRATHENFETSQRVVVGKTRHCQIDATPAGDNRPDGKRLRATLRFQTWKNNIGREQAQALTDLERV